MAKTVRIQKYLSDAGVLSRRGAEEYIRQGRIAVNGRPARLGHPVSSADVITVDGQRVRVEKEKQNLYLMLNKPRGYVTTTSDELGRRCVTQLLEGIESRVYPVGRLDKDSEGLLLFTNDGQFANLIMHPSHHITKTYRVTVRPGITEEQCATLAAGVDIGEEGEPEVTAPATVLVLDKYPDRAVVQITISQGKNRQVRRMCEAVGLTVARLKRTAVGPLRLGMLKPGDWRELKKSELIALRNASGGTAAPSSVPSSKGKKPKAGWENAGGGAAAPVPASKSQGKKPKPTGAQGKPGPKAARASALGGGRDAGDGMGRDRTGGLRFKAPDKPSHPRGKGGRGK